MSKYINADAVIAGAVQDGEREYLMSVVKNTPSIDIVRCKECRFGQWHEQAEEYICIAHDQDLFDGDHFCSYGERRE